eukprot:scaffold23158_cov96-Isochrysis_galbana.AAC.1
MVAHQHQVLGPQHDGDEALGLGGLRGLVDQALPEAQRADAGVAGGRAGAADHVRGLGLQGGGKGG